MGKVAVIADSIANPPQEIIKKYNIQILPINIWFKGKKYRDGIELNSAEAYRMLAEQPEQFHSAPATIGEYLEIFKDAAKTADSILCLTLSGKLSTVYNIASLAKSEAEEEGLTVPINVLDTGTAVNAEGLIVTAAGEAAGAGKSLDEVIRIVENLKKRVHLIGILDTVQYVYRTGRIPKFTSKVGSLLNIKPCFSISEGVVHLDGMIKNQESGIKHILKQLKENIKDRSVHISIAHSSALEAGIKLKDSIEKEFNCSELWLTDLSPIIAYATGTGVLIAAYYLDSE
jgi:DegV family protein with EDD domain